MATIVLSPHTLSKDRSDIKAEVTSSNTVGYQKVNISPGLTIVGTPFTSIEANATGLDIQSIKPADTQNSGGVSMLRRWNGSGYTEYFYFPEDQFGVGDEELPGWGDALQNEANVQIDLGEGYWIQSDKAETITLAGEVADEETVSIGSGLTLISNPLPVDIDIQKIIPSDTQNSGGVSMLRMWNGSGYTEYFYFPEDQFGVGDEELPGWGDALQNEVHVTIPAGRGFWIQSDKAETITFQNNL